MKIAHLLASHAEYGGLEKHVIELASFQARQGHEVCVLVSKEMAPRLPEELGVELVTWKRSRRDPRLIGELVKVLRKVAPDVVHAHAHKVASLVPKLLRKTGLPIVGTAHNIKRRVDGFEACDAVISPSQQVAESLGSVPVTVIWNAVPAFELAWKEEAEALNPPFRGDGKTIFCAVGRFVQAKGFHLLLEALKEVPSACLWLVGEGSDREELQKQSAELGLETRVWMPGSVSQEEAVGLMGLADLFVISSLNEGGPYTMAEALRAGCPVMSTRVGFVPEFLESSQLFESISVTAMVEGLQRFQANPERYREGMAAVIERANQELDLSGMAHKVEQVYARVLSEKRSS